MGLDMYGYTMKAEFVGDRQTDVNVSEDEREEAALNHFAYWRKFNHLHGWMENLYRQKGGKAEVFNCCTVRLELEDLDRLESDLMMKNWNTRRAFSLETMRYIPKTLQKLKTLLQMPV